MKEFSKEFMLKNCGCYSKERTTDLFFSKGNSTIKHEDILKSSIPLKDKFWFYCKKVFDKDTNQNIAIKLAEIVLPLYEAKYDSKAPREAIEAAKLYIAGHISFETLIKKRDAAANAANAAANAANAAANAANAANAATVAYYAAVYYAAAANAATNADYADYAATNAANTAAAAYYAADYVADVYGDVVYQDKILNILIEYVDKII